MTASTKRKTSLTLNAAALDCALDLEIDVSAVAEAALLKAVDDAKTNIGSRTTRISSQPRQIGIRAPGTR